MLPILLILVFAFSIIAVRSHSRNIQRLIAAKKNTSINEERRAFEFAIMKQAIYLVLSALPLLIFAAMIFNILND